MQDGRMHTLQGGMQQVTYGCRTMTQISLWGRNADGLVVAVTTMIEPERLEDHYDRTLTWAARDAGLHGIL